MINCSRLAFTIVEMLVVVSIMALLYTMIVMAFSGTEEDLIAGDASELQTTLLKARSLAMGSNRSYGVIFHIENAGDGTVFKNQSIHDREDESFIGRHWYALIGPDNSAFGGESSGGTSMRSDVLPPVALMDSNNRTEYTYFTLEDYTEAMQKVQIGARHYLSRGVRFLALSDTDELYPGHTHATYPRPWFGYYDDVSNTLYPWGAYNREIDASWALPETGLDYEGFDGPISYDPAQDTNLNPDEVWGRIWHHWDFANNVLSGSTGIHAGECVPSPAAGSVIGTEDKSIYNRYFVNRDYLGPDKTRLAKKSRPVVNGYWSDFMIVFAPDGTVSVAKGHARATYFNTTKHSTDLVSHESGRAVMGMEFDQRTGSISITLCPDIDADADAHLYPQASATMIGQQAYNVFNSVEDAFESITPFVRVQINRVDGLAVLQKNEHVDLNITPEDLLQKDPYPRGFQ